MKPSEASPQTGENREAPLRFARSLSEYWHGSRSAPRGQMQGAATQSMPRHRRGAATPQMPPRRRNPKGAWGLRAISSLLVVDDASASPPPRASTSPRKPHARDPCHYSDRLLGPASFCPALRGGHLLWPAQENCFNRNESGHRRCLAARLRLRPTRKRKGSAHPSLLEATFRSASAGETSRRNPGLLRDATL